MAGGSHSADIDHERAINRLAPTTFGRRRSVHGIRCCACAGRAIRREIVETLHISSRPPPTPATDPPSSASPPTSNWCLALRQRITRPSHGQLDKPASLHSNGGAQRPSHKKNNREKHMPTILGAGEHATWWKTLQNCRRLEPPSRLGRGRQQGPLFIFNRGAHPWSCSTARAISSPGASPCSTAHGLHIDADDNLLHR